MSILGEWGERRAAEYFLSKGYKIVARNWHAVEGEIDLIAEKDGELVFIEVKARRSSQFGTPEEAVHAAKKRRLRRTAWRYLEANEQLEAEWRIDVIAIEQNAAGNISRFDHYQHAIGDAEDASGR